MKIKFKRRQSTPIRLQPLKWRGVEIQLIGGEMTSRLLIYCSASITTYPRLAIPDGENILFFLHSLNSRVIIYTVAE